VVGLLEALETIDRCSSGIDPKAALVLIGGGARSEVWRSVVQRLSGRAISVPESTEFVAIGAAVQAAAAFSGEDLRKISLRWHTSAGTLLQPVPRDAETVSHHRAVRQQALDAVQSVRGRR
jgi:xylulokinase